MAFNLDGNHFECSCSGCRSGNSLLHQGCFGATCKRRDSARSGSRHIVADGEAVTADPGTRGSLPDDRGLIVLDHGDDDEPDPKAERAAMIERNKNAWRTGSSSAPSPTGAALNLDGFDDADTARVELPRYLDSANEERAVMQARNANIGKGVRVANAAEQMVRRSYAPAGAR